MATQPRRAGQAYQCHKCPDAIERGAYYTTYTPLYGTKRYMHLACEGLWGQYMAAKLVAQAKGGQRE